MKSILVAYATHEGQTRKISQFIAERIRAAGYEADLVDTTSSKVELISPVYIGAVLGASVHQEHHQSSFIHFVKSNLEWLQVLPTAVFSVSLAAASNDEETRHEANVLLNNLLAETGIEPTLSRCVPGALLYTRYDFFKRTMMRLISKHEGGPTDSSHDFEFTNWNAVEAFVDEFLGNF